MDRRETTGCECLQSFAVIITGAEGVAGWCAFCGVAWGDYTTQVREARRRRHADPVRKPMPYEIQIVTVPGPTAF